MLGESLISYHFTNYYNNEWLSLQGGGVFIGLLGVAYYAEIHHIAYFVVVQIFVGVFEVSCSNIIYYSRSENFHQEKIFTK